MKHKILCMWDAKAYPDILDPLEAIAEVTVEAPDQKVLVETIGRYDAYLASLKARVDKEVLARAERLKVIVTPSTGLDHIDMDEAARLGIPVLCNKEEYDLLKQITATAEMAWCLLLSSGWRWICDCRTPAACSAAVRPPGNGATSGWWPVARAAWSGRPGRPPNPPLAGSASRIHWTTRAERSLSSGATDGGATPSTGRSPPFLRGVSLGSASVAAVRFVSAVTFRWPGCRSRLRLGMMGRWDTGATCPWSVSVATRIARLGVDMGGA